MQIETIILHAVRLLLVRRLLHDQLVVHLIALRPVSSAAMHVRPSAPACRVLRCSMGFLLPSQVKKERCPTDGGCGRTYAWQASHFSRDSHTGCGHHLSSLSGL